MIITKEGANGESVIIKVCNEGSELMMCVKTESIDIVEVVRAVSADIGELSQLDMAQLYDALDVCFVPVPVNDETQLDQVLELIRGFIYE